MKTRNIFIGLLIVLFPLLDSCSEKTVGPDYPVPQPETEIGRKLAGTEGIMASLYSDTTYTLATGVQATELAYLAWTGHSIRAFVFEVDLSQDDITISQTTPDHQQIGKKLQPVTRQALACDAEDFYILGGSNADFFDTKGVTNLPHGVFHHEGVCYKNFFNPKIKRDMSFFDINDEKEAGIGLEEDYEAIAAEGHLFEVCGGGPLLVRGGNALKPVDSEEPRTCIGISEDGKTVYILVVDGRRYEYSYGMTLSELALCMKAIGAYTAINLDGGGSSTFYVRDQRKSDTDPERFVIRNWPTDNGGRERSVASGLAIIKTK